MAILSDAALNFGAIAGLIHDMQVVGESLSYCSFDWDGNNNIPCTANAAEYGKELGISGWEIRRRVKITVNIANLPDPIDLPAPNDLFTLRLSQNGSEVEYRILKTKNTEDATLEIEGVDSRHP